MGPLVDRYEGKANLTSVMTRTALASLLLVGCAGAGAAQETGSPPPASPAITVQPGTQVAGTSTLTVTGTGFDTTKGIYVAYCVQAQPGEPPTPCGGGVDTTGETASSAWVSSKPPPYGKDLAVAYGPNGSFEVTVRATARIGDYDCREVTCGVATRADHTRSSDRTQDVFIPITFEEN
jgi:hypothetical protein